ncbi:MAG: hypothetical protein WCS94_12435 [Verrucomicrobiota bacterium]
MLNQPEKIVRIVCLILGGLVLWQLTALIFRANPLGHLTIPTVPTLSTNGDVTAKPAAAHAGFMPNLATNAVVAKPPATNGSATNSMVLTNPVLSRVANTQIVAALINWPTNAVSGGTNALGVVTNKMTGRETNGVVALSGTNGLDKPKRILPEGMMNLAAMSGMPAGMGMFPQPGKASGKLTPEIQSRLDKIVDSEMFAPVMHPLPMALMGIAGELAFLRSASGQTGLVKPGDSLGEIKLLRIGINRVLIEVNGQKQELTIFEGYGGESLMPKSNDTAP